MRRAAQFRLEQGGEGGITGEDLDNAWTRSSSKVARST
jgi:hypothetical protein